MKKGFPKILKLTLWKKVGTNLAQKKIDGVETLAGP